MHANATPFLNLFEKEHRLEVPLFQRQYVWTREQQWEPLWEDISRKFVERLDPTIDRKDAPPHFLGAMVLDQKQTPTTHVEKRQVIDGQQRLITFQIFLSAFRDFCNGHECTRLAEQSEKFIHNSGMMADPTVEKYKVWPTKMDRKQFEEVIDTCSYKILDEKYPHSGKKGNRNPKPPRMIDAYFFFYENLSDFFLGVNSEKPIAGDRDLASRLEECFLVLKYALQVVVIDLGDDDDPQVIFETLNARGEPLLPADLLRNFIFLRAARNNEPQEELYETYWKKLDDEFWREEIKQGRLKRPRSDLFMQHFLTSRQLMEIPIKHLFTEYKFWIKKDNPFTTVREELATIARQGDAFRRLVEPQSNDPLFPLPNFLINFEISTAYPLLLFLMDSKLSDDELKKISTILESYLLRRAVCGFTTKSYNRTFANLTRHLQEKGVTLENIRDYLSGLSGESGEWPVDEVFLQKWQNNHAYYTLARSNRIVYILKRISDAYFSDKTERISVDSQLTIEHIMPQSWIENWPLPDGSKGLTWEEISKLDSEDPRIIVNKQRDSILQTLGNLTILTQPLNSAVSNSAWEIKKPQLLQSSLLPINQQLYSVNVWDEKAIANRGKETFERAKLIWLAPSRIENTIKN